MEAKVVAGQPLVVTITAQLTFVDVLAAMTWQFAELLVQAMKAGADMTHGT
jgi:hypothetical protein